MKNFIVIILVLFLSVSCKKELVKQPAKLIEKDKMVDIMYDLSLIEAMKYQHPVSVDSVETSPTAFILKKYKIDSLQFSQSNRYYAADYENYKSMFDEVGKRLAVNQRAVDSILKIEEKNAAKAKKTKLKDTVGNNLTKVKLDSIRKTKRLDR
ncbi:DUF4296 domain-containing protein [Flavobacterium collinsii]|jgi:hypothetical protein|uniref:DUF4296 domain-containing protein n=1 Tax=Flavobacterium collinsii TaxID=1114861 RepID=A0A9W4X275_9FLAO|nr:DUF4296 domain-containing protein [Flavobacterium collinsii]GIQ60258.1 lipoprotein precursor [Flavobacterium collinsii]CAA9198040.1 hypothetical protein FLACOL7796_01985 [Flavobacterium collinsii]CAI2765628.1 conserved protein of unknown function [Flavobacterium collinsii]